MGETDREDNLMAGPYYIYSGATGTGDGSSWTDAFTSWYDMQDLGGGAAGPGTSGNALTATDTVYVASDHDDSATTYGASLTIYGPTSDPPVKVISADRTSGTPPTTYTAGSATNQIDTRDGTYAIAFDGAFAVYGLVIANGATDNTITANDATESVAFYGCRFKPPHAGRYRFTPGIYSRALIHQCVFDHVYDTSNTTVLHRINGNTEIIGCSVANANYRTATTGYLELYPYSTGITISSCDWSGLANASYFLSAGTDGGGRTTINNCLFAAGTSLTPYTLGHVATAIEYYNCGTTDAPEALRKYTAAGTVLSTTSVYRTGGASVEDVGNVSWAVTTTAGADEGCPLYTPWLYGVISSTGSKTFTVYIANEGEGDLGDNDIWLEVEALGSSNSPLTTYSSDHRSTILSTAAPQTDDTTSSWTGITANYMQSLGVSGVTVNETGQFRARVAIGQPSLDSGTDKLHIDPKVTVS